VPHSWFPSTWAHQILAWLVAMHAANINTSYHLCITPSFVQQATFTDPASQTEEITDLCL
jgi:creatinine amidohydrolase/Fe(II)-dependent formamide hydrolase-like protein